MKKTQGLAPVLIVLFLAILLGGGYVVSKTLGVCCGTSENETSAYNTGYEGTVMVLEPSPAYLTVLNNVRDGISKIFKGGKERKSFNKTYRSDTYRFSFNYPDNLIFFESKNDVCELDIVFNDEIEFKEGEGGYITNVISLCVADKKTEINSSYNAVYPLQDNKNLYVGWYEYPEDFGEKLQKTFKIF